MEGGGQEAGADPAALSSSGMWHRNFNGRATRAAGSERETRCACQSTLTRVNVNVVEGEMMGKGREGAASRRAMVEGSKGTALRCSYSSERGGEKKGQPG